MQQSVMFRMVSGEDPECGNSRKKHIASVCMHAQVSVVVQNMFGISQVPWVSGLSENTSQTQLWEGVGRRAQDWCGEAKSIPAQILESQAYLQVTTMAILKIPSKPCQSSLDWRNELLPFQVRFKFLLRFVSGVLISQFWWEKFGLHDNCLFGKKIWTK